MPLVQRIIKHGGSRGIVLPASWLRHVEQTSGPVCEVLLEVNGSITVTPNVKEAAKT